MDVNAPIPSAAEYEAAFAEECARHEQYAVVDHLETRLGFAIERERLWAAARTLACPVKANPPNWQHGRVVYALARSVLANGRARLTQEPPCIFVDIGTAKGFSALMMAMAIEDHQRGRRDETVNAALSQPGPLPLAGVQRVESWDVLDPTAAVRRNSVLEVDGLKTLDQYLAPWPRERRRIDFKMVDDPNQVGLKDHALWEMRALDRPDRGMRVPFAFIDGKHDYEHVSRDADRIARLQVPGDIILFDDTHLPGVENAVKALPHRHPYRLDRYPVLLRWRSFTVATKT